MKLRHLLFSAALAAGCFSLSAADVHPGSNFLWYEQPAGVAKTALPWDEAPVDAPNLPGKRAGNTWECQTLPVGNGRIGGTIYGGDKRDCIVLNEVSLWSGGPNLPNNGTSYAHGPLEGKDTFGSFQPFGSLFVDYDAKGKTSHYERSLDITKAVAGVEFENEGVKHMRDLIASKDYDVMIYRARVDKAGALNAKIALLPFHTVEYSVQGKDTIIMRGTLANGEVFEGRIAAKLKGGSVKVQGASGKVEVTYQGKGDGMQPQVPVKSIPYFEVTGAEECELYITLATDYKEDYKSDWKGKDPAELNTKLLKNALSAGYATIRKKHEAAYAEQFNRLKIKLGKSSVSTSQAPTDKRIEQYRKTGKDPELESTVFQYGRYMLISGTRPGTLPLTLQGIWNNKVHPAWACDYHNNINLQMCYWGAEVGNLSECHTTFIDYIKAMEEPLHKMTQKQFGENIRGWTTRISQNPWGGGGWVKWNPPVNAWYALHVWDHYNFSQDKAYLKKTGYPILKTICEFWEDHLKEVGENGVGLKSAGKPLSADQFPELREIKAGSLVAPDGWSHEWGPIEDGCKHDQQLIWELFDNTAKAAEIVGDKAYAEKLIGLRDRLVGNRIGRDGYLQEWIVDRPNMISGHRHTSHLIGVYPGTSISMEKTPEFCKAAAKSLELRGMSGDNRRSWTWPWRTALWSRMGNTAKAYEMVQGYLKYNMLDNLFGNHPPMQLDGTYGITGGMAEMLIQSHAGIIELLPTLPSAWANGEIKGIRARGNITVDMKWRNGRITSYRLTTTSKPKLVKLKVNGEIKTVTPESVDAAKTPSTGKKKKEKAAAESPLDNNALIGWGLGALLLLIFIILGARSKR